MTRQRFPTTITPEVVYTVCFEWDHDDSDKALKAVDSIYKLKQPDDVEFTDNAAGPCWSYQLTITGKNLKRVKAFSEKVFRLLNRRGCYLVDLYTGAKE